MRRKIAVIGPVYPLRGGIAHSNTLLCENLSNGHDLYAVSFKRLYPEFLYPGKSQKYESKRQLGFEPDFCIDSLNPFNWIKTFNRIRKFKPQLVILQWWTPFFAPLSYTILVLTRWFTNAKSCIICANVTQHEDKLVDKMLTMIVFRRADYFITLADGDLKKLKKWYPKAKARVLIEPTFDSIFNLGAVSKEAAQKKLKLAKRTILFFGFVREYKGLDYLLEAMPLINTELDVDLVIAGEFWNDKQKYLDKISTLKIKDKVKIFDNYIPDEEVGLYFSAADMVILPYLDASQSGIMQIAIGALKPTVTTNVGAIDDFVDHGKTGYVIPPKDPQAIAKAVLRFYKEKKEKKFEQNIRQKKKMFEWSKKKESILFFGLNGKN
ncbi:MAG: glycosyltransferase [Candidatus Woesearchaeota archaeon]